MKKIILLLAVLSATVPGFAQTGNVLQDIAAQILGDRFGMRTSDILKIKQETHEDVWDLGPTLSMSRYGDSSPNEVHRLRASGMGWGEIAKEIGMHPGTFNKLRKQGYFDREDFWDDVVRRRYDLRQDEIDAIRRRGARADGVLGTAIICKESGKRPTEVYDRYRTTKSWTRTASGYKANLNNWERFGKRVRWEGSSKPSTKSSVKGTSKSGVRPMGT